MLEKLFKLKENHTTAKTEIMAGITTFMTMAYILAVNPSTMTAFNDILGLEGSARMNPGGVFMATALAAVIGTLIMAFAANYPFALAPGMGLNAYFCYTVVVGMGYSWQTALTAVFVEGIIFIILSMTNVREAIFNAIPQTLKIAVGCGIGIYIAFIGMQRALQYIHAMGAVMIMDGRDRSFRIPNVFDKHAGILIRYQILLIRHIAGILANMLMLFRYNPVCRNCEISLFHPN